MKTFKQFLVALVATVALLVGFNASAQTQLPVPTSASPNYTGMWWNKNESGWGMPIVHQENILFVTVYTYDNIRPTEENNPPMWIVVSGAYLQPDGTYKGTLYRATGSPYNTVPYVTNIPDGIAPIGEMTLTFTSKTTGTVTYSVNGVVVTKQIEQMVYGVAPADCKFTDNPDRSKDTNYQDLWWNPMENGWGVQFAHQYLPRGEILFATLYIYGLDRKDFWVVGSNMVKQADGSFYGPLHKAVGPAFNANPFPPLSEANAGQRLTELGTIRFIPFNGEKGTLIYSINGEVITKAIERLVFRYPVQTCTTVTTPQMFYTDKVYAIWTAASPYSVTKTGVKPVVNKTSYTAGNFPIFNCGIANKPLADGKVLLDCQERTTLQARKFYIDPTKDEMYDYTGTVPADITFTFVQRFDSNKPEWGAKAKVSDGWYFTTFDVTWVLKFQFDQGGAIITVKAGTFAADGSINVLASFSH